ncbi:ATP-binding protein [Acanthopleuribacter pedis]|uniref:histidine kinase n=1 Tax=Acanthopleuribacter pedis TaxID=442870 RepID=A0A8J7Q7C7_9BACT|nr:ATP-binding protein [Acanthopleuribacter pedis]MBO1318139.1 cyclic nucleotide-binding domain-containing protein [Acanthopleuribacter pedis]
MVNTQELPEGLRSILAQVGDGPRISAMLQCTDMFREFSRDDLLLVADQAQVVVAEIGVFLMQEGETMPRLFLLVEGRLDILKKNEAGGMQRITAIEPGSAVGEMALLDGQPISASIQVVARATLILFSESNLNSMAERAPAVYIKILKKIARQTSLRLRQTTNLLNKNLQQTADLTEAFQLAMSQSNPKEREDLLASMSHELRTPLNAILGYTELVEEEIMESKTVENIGDLKRIQVAGRHMLNLINNILDFSKMEAKRMDLHVESISVPTLLEDISGMVKPLALVNDNQVQVICPENLSRIEADTLKVRQALINLMSNACKFTDHGEVVLSVSVVESEGKDYVLFAVSDNGIGMSQDEVAQLFQEYNQVGEGGKHTGTGLGLYLSRKFCRMMGGDIEVVSEKGVGTTFTMRLPAKQPGRIRAEQ